MGKWKIYKSDGTPLTDVNGKEMEIRSLQYNGEWMGACNLNVEIKNEAPVNFSIGDYIEYRGERFEINYDPGKIKAASKDASGESFKYDNVVFNSMVDELARAECLDVVLSDSQIHYTALPNFTFYVTSIDDILDRLQANMDEQYGKGAWHFYSSDYGRSVTNRHCDEATWQEMYGTDTKTTVKDSTSIAVSSQKVWEILGLVNTQFDVNFTVRGRNVFVGIAGVVADHIFKYGKGNGLYEIEETADESQAVITRLRAYGNTTNLPTRFYAEVGARCFANVEKADSYVPGDHGIAGCTLTLDLVFPINAFNEKRVAKAHDLVTNDYYYKDQVVATVTLDDTTVVTGALSKSTTDEKKSTLSVQYTDDGFSADGTLYDNTYNKSREDVVKFINAVKEGSVLFFTNAKRSKFPSKNIKYTSDLPNNMAIDRLMLPGFPNESLQSWWNRQSDEKKAWLNPGGREHKFSADQYRPYVESLAMDEIGIRPASVFFDSDNEKEGLKDIFPTLEEMEVDGKRIDQIDTGTEEEIKDDGVYKDGQTVPNFNVYLRKEIDFDLKTLADDDFTLNMKDGMCGGRSFKVAAVAKEKDGRWKMRLEREKDSDLDLYFPYKDYPIKAGDRFVLTGLDMPEAYVQAASEKLLKYAIAKLDDNDYTRKTYTPKVDEIYMARQNDEAEADKTGKTKSLYRTLKEGDIMQFEDADLGIDTRITIEKLSIKEQDDKIPTYEITLKEEKDVGKIQKIQNQISSIVSGSTGVGGFTSGQVRDMVVSAGKEYFLSKLDDDKARGLITFLKGLGIGTRYSISETGDAVLGDAVLGTLTSSDYSSAAQSGYGMERRDDGKFRLSLTDLEVWGKAVFHELEVRKLSYAGGNFIFSPAGSTLMHVEAVKTKPIAGAAAITISYKCYFLADDGTTATQNLWKEGDLARCESFNVEEGTYQNVSNKFYWRKVTAVSKENEQITDDKDNVLYGGQKFGWVELGNAMPGTDHKRNSDAPAVGDVIVCMGNASVSDRQNAVVIQTNGELAPAIIQYGGIKTFDLTGCVKTQISPKGNKFIGDFTMITSDDDKGVNVKDAIDDVASDANKKIESTKSELTTTINGIKGTVTDITKQVDGQGNGLLEKRVATIEQTANSISLKVDQQAVRNRNLLPNSYFMHGNDRYGCCKRAVHLEKGKCYALSVWGKIDGTLKARGGQLTAYVFNADWSWQKNVQITSTEETRGVTKFNDVPLTGDYIFYVYPTPRKDGSGKFFVRCAQVEEIPSLDDDGTAWTVGKEDPAAYGNLLPRLGEWTLGDGSALTAGGYVADGRSVDMVYGKASASDDKDVIVLYGKLTLAPGESYTLSFWAKGSGSFQSYLFPDACSWAVRDDGTESQIVDGSILPDRMLTSDWRKYWVVFSVKTESAVNLLPVRLRKGGEAWVAGIKLEPFGMATEYTDQPVTADELKATGIDIKDRSITVTADHFLIQTNRGDKVFATDGDRVTIVNVDFGGMINKQPLDVKADNFALYFDSFQNPFSYQWSAMPKIAKMYGVYYFSETIGKSTADYPLTLSLPSAYVNPSGYFSGDVYDSDGNLSRALLRSVRALVGNTVLIYNDGKEDICVEGMSSYFEDVWDSASKQSAVEKSAVAVQSSVVAQASVSTSPSNGGKAEDATSGLYKPTGNGSVNPNQRYVGRRRNEVTVTLKGGKHQFVSLQCVCEVGESGWENIYWLVNYGQGLDT